PGFPPRVCVDPGRLDGAAERNGAARQVRTIAAVLRITQLPLADQRSLSRKRRSSIPRRCPTPALIRRADDSSRLGINPNAVTVPLRLTSRADGVAHLLQPLQHIGMFLRQFWLDVYAVRKPLMMEPRRIYRLPHVHLEINNIRDYA